MKMWQCGILLPAVWAMVLLQGCSNKDESQAQSEPEAAKNLIAEYDKQISALKDVANSPDACNKMYLSTEALAVKWKAANDKVKDGEPTQGQEIAKKQKEFKDALQTCYKSDEDKKAMDPKVKAFLADPGKGLTKRNITFFEQD